MLFLPARAIRAPKFAFACSRTIDAMPFWGSGMSFYSFQSLPAEPVSYQEIRRQIDRREKLIAVLAPSLGVLIVAAIAILMGMA